MSSPMVADPDRPAGIARLRRFVADLAGLIDSRADEAHILQHGAALLSALVAHDDWLPAAYAAPHPDRYQQYLLYCDARERFCVVAFVWGPGQATPIHDHRVWGLIGMLRGIESSERFAQSADGGLHAIGAPTMLHSGEVEAVSPRIGDIHRVANANGDAPAISIHVYGGDIGAIERASYAADGTERRFISGYANCVLPNLWDCSGRR